MSLVLTFPGRRLVLAMDDRHGAYQNEGSSFVLSVAAKNFGHRCSCSSNHSTFRATTSSVNTLNPVNWHGPKDVDIATSVASRPRAIKIRPIRGMLCRASNVYQRSPRNTSNQALKSIGAGSGGTPISPKYPVQYRAGTFMQRHNVIARCAKSRQTPCRESWACHAVFVGSACW